MKTDQQLREAIQLTDAQRTELRRQLNAFGTAVHAWSTSDEAKALVEAFVKAAQVYAQFGQVAVDMMNDWAAQHALKRPELQAKPSPLRHVFKPHSRWPWWCKQCGYPPHETLKHLPAQRKDPR